MQKTRSIIVAAESLHLRGQARVDDPMIRWNDARLAWTDFS